MDGEIGKVISPKETRGAVNGTDDCINVVSSSNLLDLHLQTGDLDLYSDGLDRDGEDFDHGYQDDTPPSSALCAKSHSCDSCINISRCISLEFSKGSKSDLAGINNTDQHVNSSLEATRHFNHRSSKSSYRRHSASLPRYTKFRSYRWLPSFRVGGGGKKAGAGEKGIRRTPRFLRSHSRFQSHDRTTSRASEISRGSSAEDISQNLTTEQEQENVFLFDHMMSFDRSIGNSEPPSLVENSSERPNQPLQNPKPAISLENARPSGPNPLVETQRTVSFNTPNLVTSYVSNQNSSPCASATRFTSPGASLSHSVPSVTRTPTGTPCPSLSRIHSQQSSINLNSSRSASQNNPAKIMSTEKRGAHKIRVDSTIENTLKAIARGRSTQSEINEIRCRSNKSSRSSVSTVISRSHSNLKFNDAHPQRSETISIHDQSEKSQVQTRPRKKASCAVGGLFTQAEKSEQDTGQDIENCNVLRVPGRRLSVQERVPSPVEEKPSVCRVQKNKQGSSKERAKNSGLPVPRRDVRHPSDSGFASSASSVISPSPRGQTNVHHYVVKKRTERNSADNTALAHSNKRQTSTSNTNILKESETKVHIVANKFHDTKKVPIPETIEESPGVNTPKCSSGNTRSQLEKDFHNLLESLGFVSRINEEAREFFVRRIRDEMRRKANQPGSTADCSISKEPNPAALQRNPSQYSIPKANFLLSAKTSKGTNPMTAPAPTPSVLLSDDPDDPRRRPDLKAARQYLDNPAIPAKSVYRSELFEKVEANKARSQRVESKRPSVTAKDENSSKPPERASDSKRASQASISRNRSRPTLVPSQKPINVEQIRSIKQTVDKAIAEGKIFVIYGAFPSIRDALKSRGWLEKRPYPDKKTPTENDPTAVRNRGSRDLFQYGTAGVQTLQSADPSVLALIESMSTNPNEIDFEEELTERAIVARMLRNVDPNFIWTVKCEAADWKRLNKKQIINRFPRAFFSTKIGLSTFLRQMHWFSEEGISMTRFPRCYNICQADDMEAFIDDFRITACVGVLKIVIDRFGRMGDAGIQDDNGKVPKYALEFAISRCVEYLVQNNHADLDQSAPVTVHCNQWDQFLGWSYELRTDNGRFSKTCSEPTPQAMNETARDIIRRMAEVCPQMDLDGYLNIWILKPGAKSRGRGIHLINRLDSVTENVSPQHIRDARYVAQKYIERPLIIFGTKFDIRQWFLVTSVYPMTVWMYRESYLRFCSQAFSLTNMHESVHLCNNAVQAKYKNGKRDPSLPDENMWDCYTFQTYLRALGRPELWDTVIYPGMRQGIIGTLLASQEHMDRRNDCFELFGADFMLTEDFSPWLIEINSCPCMAPSTSVTARMCAQCLEDVIKVVIDRQNDKNADTGRFELVYKQHIPPPPPYVGMNLSVKGRRVKTSSSSNVSAMMESTGQSLQQVNRRTRRPASDPTRRLQRHPRIVLPSTERYQLKEKLSNDSEATLPAEELSGSESESGTPTSADNESRPPRTPTPTCPKRLESLRCTRRPSVVGALTTKQKTKRNHYNALAAVGHGVIQPSRDNHKKSMELLREWRQRARTSGLLSLSSPSKLGSLSSAHSAEMMRRMSSSSSGSNLIAVGVTLNGLAR